MIESAVKATSIQSITECDQNSLNMKFNREERIGVFSVAKIFVDNFNWIFHEQAVTEFGIDAFVEVTESPSWKTKKHIPTGRLIGIQIKSGTSFFRESKFEHFVYRGSKTHLRYWLNYSIPVVIILYDQQSNVAYWQQVNESTATYTGKGFKINVPKTNTLSTKNINILTKIGYFKNDYELGLWNMRYSIDLIRSVISESHYAYVQIEECFSNENYRIRLFITTEEDFFYATTFPECEGTDYFFHLRENQSISEGLKSILPWAYSYYNSEPFLDELLAKELIEEALRIGKLESGDGNYSRNFPKSILKVACEMVGEYWFRLKIRPNELAFNFLKVDEFLENVEYNLILNY